MKLFKDKSYVEPRYQKITEDAAKTIESMFNTKILDFGIAPVGSYEFEYLTVKLYTPPLDGSKYIVYFLVPIDDSDNIITNDYYEKQIQASNPKVRNSPTHIFSSFGFNSILKKDTEISSYLEKRFQTTIFNSGKMRVSEYSNSDNIVKNAKKIDDLRYEIFRFFAS